MNSYDPNEWNSQNPQQDCGPSDQPGQQNQQSQPYQQGQQSYGPTDQQSQQSYDQHGQQYQHGQPGFNQTGAPQGFQPQEYNQPINVPSKNQNGCIKGCLIIFLIGLVLTIALIVLVTSSVFKGLGFLGNKFVDTISPTASVVYHNAESVLPGVAKPLTAGQEAAAKKERSEWLIDGSIGFELISDTTVDSDEDGLTDEEEIGLEMDPNNVDTDNDGLADEYELSLDSDPISWSTAGDDISDGAKFKQGWSLFESRKDSSIPETELSWDGMNSSAIFVTEDANTSANGIVREVSIAKDGQYSSEPYGYLFDQFKGTVKLAGDYQGYTTGFYNATLDKVYYIPSTVTSGGIEIPIKIEHSLGMPLVLVKGESHNSIEVDTTSKVPEPNFGSEDYWNMLEQSPRDFAVYWNDPSGNNLIKGALPEASVDPMYSGILGSIVDSQYKELVGTQVSPYQIAVFRFNAPTTTSEDVAYQQGSIFSSHYHIDTKFNIFYYEMEGTKEAAKKDTAKLTSRLPEIVSGALGGSDHPVIGIVEDVLESVSGTEYLRGTGTDVAKYIQDKFGAPSNVLSKPVEPEVTDSPTNPEVILDSRTNLLGKTYHVSTDWEHDINDIPFRNFGDTSGITNEGGNCAGFALVAASVFNGEVPESAGTCSSRSRVIDYSGLSTEIVDSWESNSAGAYEPTRELLKALKTNPIVDLQSLQESIGEDYQYLRMIGSNWLHSNSASTAAELAVLYNKKSGSSNKEQGLNFLDCLEEQFSSNKAVYLTLPGHAVVAFGMNTNTSYPDIVDIDVYDNNYTKAHNSAGENKSHSLKVRIITFPTKVTFFDKTVTVDNNYYYYDPSVPFADNPVTGKGKTGFTDLPGRSTTATTVTAGINKRSALAVYDPVKMITASDSQLDD